MKSIGETLKEARESKDASVKQIAQEINISREYLEALEEERFDIFPAETYLLGFLRNYAEYLGLDQEKSVALYKNYKKSEEPVPLEELVGQQKGTRIPARFFVIIVLLAVLGGGGWFLLQTVLANRPEPVVQEPVRSSQQFRLDESEAQWTLMDGDEILIAYEKGELHMSVILEDTKLRIQPVGGGSELVMAVGDEKILPGGEGIPVIGFRLRSLDAQGALLAVQKTDVAVVREAVAASEDPAAELPLLEGGKVLLLEDREAPENYNLNAFFTGYSLFRYQADDGEAVEKFYRDGDRIRLDVRETLTIGYSSGGDMSLKISGVSVATGRAGEVAVKFIQWVKDDEGTYDLVLFPVQ